MAGRLRSSCGSAVPPLSSRSGIVSALQTTAAGCPPLPAPAAFLSKPQPLPLGLHSYRSLSPIVIFRFLLHSVLNSCHAAIPAAIDRYSLERPSLYPQSLHGL